MLTLAAFATVGGGLPELTATRFNNLVIDANTRLDLVLFISTKGTYKSDQPYSIRVDDTGKTNAHSGVGGVMKLRMLQSSRRQSSQVQHFPKG